MPIICETCRENMKKRKPQEGTVIPVLRVQLVFLVPKVVCKPPRGDGNWTLSAITVTDTLFVPWKKGKPRKGTVTHLFLILKLMSLEHEKKKNPIRGDGNLKSKYSEHSFFIKYKKKRKTPRGDGNSSFTNVPLIIFPFLFDEQNKNPIRGTVTFVFLQSSPS